MSQEPLTASNRPSSGPLARPPDHSNAAWLSQDTSHSPTSPGLAVIQVLEAGSPQDSTVLRNCQVLEQENLTQMALSWRKGLSVHKPQVSTVRDTDSGCQHAPYCPQLQGQACRTGHSALARPSSCVASVIGGGPGCTVVTHQPAATLVAGRRKVRSKQWACPPCLLTRKPSQPHCNGGHLQLGAPPNLRDMKRGVLVGLSSPHSGARAAELATQCRQCGRFISSSASPPPSQASVLALICLFLEPGAQEDPHFWAQQSSFHSITPRTYCQPTFRSVHSKT